VIEAQNRDILKLSSEMVAAFLFSSGVTDWKRQIIFRLRLSEFPQ